MAEKILRSFKPLVDRHSRVLILGSMPGPVALKKRQFYGFDGNHFWHIMPKLFGRERSPSYEERIQMLREQRVALWDVLHSCRRKTALDADIKNPKPNRIPELLKKFPNIKAVFINGRAAYNIFMKHFGAHIKHPVFYLPSSSPANAAISPSKKIEAWKIILKFLDD